MNRSRLTHHPRLWLTLLSVLPALPGWSLSVGEGKWYRDPLHETFSLCTLTSHEISLILSESCTLDYWQRQRCWGQFDIMFIKQDNRSKPIFSEHTGLLHSWTHNSLWYLPMIKPVNILAWNGKGFMSLYFQLKPMDSWWLLGDGRFKGVEHSRSTTLDGLTLRSIETEKIATNELLS